MHRKTAEERKTEVGERVRWKICTGEEKQAYCSESAWSMHIMGVLYGERLSDRMKLEGEGENKLGGGRDRKIDRNINR
jgi:hypothetical protein